MVEEIIDKMTAGWIDDINQNTTYKLEDIYNGWEENYPRSFLLNTTPIQDQRNCKYPNGCTRYGGSHAINETNHWTTTQGNELWIRAVDNKQGSVKTGSSMTSFIQQAQKSWIINWYAVVNKQNRQLIKQAIYNSKAIYTGSNRIDRTKMVRGKTNVAIIGSGIGHIFALVGWNDDEGVYILRDSFWPLYWGDGHFKVKYEDIEALYTLIVFTTPEEHQNLQAITDQAMKQKAINKGISNGKDLQYPATREQCAIMIGRLKYGLLEDSELLLKTKELWIWNGTRPQDTLIREEMLLMFARYMGYEWTDEEKVWQFVQKWYASDKNPKNAVTREQILIVSGRTIS